MVSTGDERQLKPAPAAAGDRANVVRLKPGFICDREHPPMRQLAWRASLARKVNPVMHNQAILSSNGAQPLHASSDQPTRPDRPRESPARRFLRHDAAAFAIMVAAVSAVFVIDMSLYGALERAVWLCLPR
jgi:hypothetical protein